jgi:hypothetical protein
VGNSFFGEIPSQIGELSSLLELELGRNFFTGKIPTTVGNMTSLEVFEIADNQITGLIPSEIGLLENLQVFIIDTNTIDSPIPAEMGELASLGKKRIRKKYPQVDSNTHLYYDYFHPFRGCGYGKEPVFRAISDTVRFTR